MLKRTLAAVDLMNCGRCVTYLSYIFGKGDTFVRIGDIKTTPRQFMYELSAACTLPGTSVGPVTFIGGPPGQAKEHTGTFGTLLKDCILRAVYNNNTKSLLALRNSRLIDD